MNKNELQGVVTKYLFLSIFTLLLILAGCQKDDKNEKDKTKTPDSSPKQETSVEKEEEVISTNRIVPIQVKNGVFQTISGWGDNEHILYILEDSNGSNVYSHNIQNGSDNLLFESESPIVSVMISPSKEYFLVHSAPTTNEATLNVLKLNGEPVLEKSIPSTELSIEWNPFDGSSILITSFTEDWDFSVWQMDLKQSSLVEVAMPQPFGYWLSKKTLLYLDWNMEEPALYTNAKKFDLATGEIQDYLANIFQVDSFGDVFVTIGADEQDEKKARYTFYQDKMEIFSFETPHLSRYSDWLIPYYDYNGKTNTFLTYQPLYSTEADVYQDGFQLISYQLDSGENEVLFEGMENTPLSCSPDGQKCLSGYYLEKLIDLDTKKMITLVNEKKD
ncbi:YqgU-like beta propeller domain-containing protein [Robertmurraya sp. Marseille-Q9965]